MSRHPEYEKPRAVRRRAMDNTGTWASTSSNHASADAGDNRRCLSVAEMIARGWYRNAAGFWAMVRLESARRAQLWPALGDPAPLPYPDTHMPVLHAAAADAP